MSDLKAQLLAERVASYRRLRGGFPIPLAGAVYWLVLAALGTVLPLPSWLSAAEWGSGLLFPLALLLSALFRVDFMADRTPVKDVLIPTYVSMLLFWPMFVAGVWAAPQLGPLILAIGMSLHWPVIGWSFGRTALYTIHAVVRAAVVFFIWISTPEARLTLLPLSVAVVYLATVAAIRLDLALSGRRPGRTAAARQAR